MVLMPSSIKTRDISLTSRPPHIESNITTAGLGVKSKLTFLQLRFLFSMPPPTALQWTKKIPVPARFS